MPRVLPPLPFSLTASRVWQPFSSNHHLLLVSGDASKAAETLIKIILFCGGVFENPFSIQFQRVSAGVTIDAYFLYAIKKNEIRK